MSEGTPDPGEDRWLSGRRICFTVNADWFFLSHRLPLAKAAQRHGAEVVVVAGDRGRVNQIEAEGLRFVPLAISRSGRSPVDNCRTIASLWRSYRELQPDLVHHVSLKPVAYGSVVARWLGIPAVINAVSGLGYNFRADGPSTFTEWTIRFLLRHACKHPHSRVILQNPDDHMLFLKEGLASDQQIVVIRGSGVDCSQFIPSNERGTGPSRVVLASRMLWSKGVGEFVDAARRLENEGVNCDMVLVGPTDKASPDGVEPSQLHDWNERGIVRWEGYRSDMPAVFRSADIAVLPSMYREGVPKVLIEAAACAIPIVTTDTPGCREIVRHGENGLLVPPGDTGALVEALTTLITDAELREEMGRRGREIVIEEFSLERVVEQTMDVYRELLT